MYGKMHNDNFTNNFDFFLLILNYLNCKHAKTIHFLIFYVCTLSWKTLQICKMKNFIQEVTRINKTLYIKANIMLKRYTAFGITTIVENSMQEIK